jgi:hypothetical protein
LRCIRLELALKSLLGEKIDSFCIEQCARSAI